METNKPTSYCLRMRDFRIDASFAELALREGCHESKKSGEHVCAFRDGFSSSLSAQAQPIVPRESPSPSAPAPTPWPSPPPTPSPLSPGPPRVDWSSQFKGLETYRRKLESGRLQLEGARASGAMSIDVYRSEFRNYRNGKSDNYRRINRELRKSVKAAP